MKTRKNIFELISTSLKLAAPIAAVLATNPVHAENVNYRYFGAHYMSQDLDDFDCTQDGVELFGTMPLNEVWAAQASYSDVSGDGCGSSSLTLSGLYHNPLNETFDWYARAGFQSVDIDGGGDDDGLLVAFGARGFVSNSLELDVSTQYNTVGDGQLSLNGAASLFVQKNTAVTAGIGLSGDYTVLKLGGKYHF